MPNPAIKSSSILVFCPRKYFCFSYAEHVHVFSNKSAQQQMNTYKVTNHGRLCFILIQPLCSVVTWKRLYFHVRVLCFYGHGPNLIWPASKTCLRCNQRTHVAFLWCYYRNEGEIKHYVNFDCIWCVDTNEHILVKKPAFETEIIYLDRL